MVSKEGPVPPNGYIVAYLASEGGWCFIEEMKPGQRASETGQNIIHVHEDGSPRM